MRRVVLLGSVPCIVRLSDATRVMRSIAGCEIEAALADCRQGEVIAVRLERRWHWAAKVGTS